MLSGKKLIVGILFLISSFPSLTQTGQAKSLYAITNFGYNTISAYSISGDQIQKQISANFPSSGCGPVGLALDPDSATLFVSYDCSCDLELINAKIMTEIKNITAPAELAGLVFDQSKQKLYAVGRGTDQLFVYLWDAATKTLTLEGGTYKTLDNLLGYGAYGIALDENAQCLFVTNITNAVKYYSTVDWTYQGSIDIVVNGNQRYAVGIAFYDNGQGSKYLYTGSWSHETGHNHNYLVRTDITDINSPSSIQYDVGASVLGITVDEDTGLVYVTTYYNQYNHHIEVYDDATFPSGPCYTEPLGTSSPAGIVVAGDVSYKPPLFYLEKVDVNGLNPVIPGDYITYQITYGPNGISDNNVVITDYLPGEVDYENLPDPNYNPEKHTYIWQIGSLAANDPNKSVTLMVKVNEGAAPNGIITNYCEIESDANCTAATAVTNVGYWQPNSEIIYVDSLSPCAPGTGMSWRFAYRDLQDAFARAGCGSQIWVAAGTYKPTQNPSETTATFDLVSSVPIYGGFPSGGGQRDWVTNETILDGQISGSSCVFHVVTADGIEDATLDGLTIRGSYAPSVFGAGVFLQNDANVKIVNCKLKDNYCYGISCDHSRAVITNSAFDGDNMTPSAISDANSSDVKLSNCTIKNHTASGIFVEDSNIEIIYCSPLRNRPKYGSIS